MASAPDPHSPTMSIASSSCNNTCRLLRANGSSSTMSARSLACTGSVLSKRNRNGRHDTFRFAILQIQRELVSVQDFQAISQIRNAGACVRFFPFHGKTRTVIVDIEIEHVVGTRCIDANRASLRPLRYSMFDCVLDQRLQNEVRDLRLQQFSRNVDTHLQAVAEPYLLNLQVLLEKLHFFEQRHLRPVGVLDDASQKIAESRDRIHG